MEFILRQVNNIEQSTGYKFSNEYQINTINCNVIVYKKEYDEFKNMSLSPIYVENYFAYNLINYLNFNYANCECGLYPNNKEHAVCECIYLNIDNIPISCNYCYYVKDINKKQHHISQCPSRIRDVEKACLLLNYHKIINNDK
jgi:hypothetical protein